MVPPEGFPPKIVYGAPEGAQAAVAAGIHLGVLPTTGRPRPEEFVRAPYFATLGEADRGFLHFCGIDGEGREVYLAGAGRAFPLLARAIREAAGLAGLPHQTFHLIDCAPVLDFLARLGGRCWAFFFGPGRGRLFLAWTLRRCYPGLAELVLRTGRAVR
ncbi:MAG: DUF3189 family protein [Firmicutes bacterium]|nr:DUF3189 family protein [Bacillota bacterium]